ncbi:vegetative cell wall protein gp1-like [Sciurus carolinensis]|uniref:vegetative cell wall protein gp1-like n=1 Tax=Sciurus carolinensis TaxID=30640 RepID=UPI001FB3806A|nr:vegetative cell wall protein gp1-like [Sciurus carolinensis]
MVEAPQPRACRGRVRLGAAGQRSGPRTAEPGAVFRAGAEFQACRATAHRLRFPELQLRSESPGPRPVSPQPLPCTSGSRPAQKSPPAQWAQRPPHPADLLRPDAASEPLCPGPHAGVFSRLPAPHASFQGGPPLRPTRTRKPVSLSSPGPTCALSAAAPHVLPPVPASSLPTPPSRSRGPCAPSPAPIPPPPPAHLLPPPRQPGTRLSAPRPRRPQIPEPCSPAPPRLDPGPAKPSPPARCRFPARPRPSPSSPPASPMLP